MILGRRTAFLIGNQSFRADSNLLPLRGPKNDVREMQRILEDPERGNFKVHILEDQNSYEIKSVVDEELSISGRGDLVLIHYTGHGKLDRSGNLCLATADTKSSALHSTSIPTQHLRDMISNSDCEAVILILDCCYSGVATSGQKGAIENQLQLLENAAGLFILAASSDIQTASEVETDHNGLIMGRFTSAIVEGIERGTADYDQDGSIHLSDIVRHVKSCVRTQTPQWFAANAHGDPRISSNPLAKSSAQIVQMMNKLDSDNWQQRVEAIAFLAEQMDSNPDSSDAIRSVLDEHFRRERSKEFRTLVYDSDRSVIQFDGWNSFCYNNIPGSPFKLGPKVIEGVRCYEIRSPYKAQIGVNRTIELNRGSICFRYKTIELTGKNIIFRIIPIRYGEPTGTGRRRHGHRMEYLDIKSSPELGQLQIFPDAVSSGWTEAKMDFDFYRLGLDVFAIFGPCINEDPNHRGPGHIVFASVKIFEM